MDRADPGRPDARGQAPSADPLGNRTRIGLDQMGRVLEEETPRGYASAVDGDFTTTYAYDANGRLVSRTLPWQAGQYGLDQAELGARTMTRVLDAVEIDAPGSAPVPNDPQNVQSHADEELRRITTRIFEGRDMPWQETTQTDLADAFEDGQGGADDDQLSDDERTRITEYDPNGNLRREVNPAGAAAYPTNPDPGVPATKGHLTLPDNAEDTEIAEATRNATVYEYSADDLKTAVDLPWDGASGSADAERYRQDFELYDRGWIKSVSAPYEWLDQDAEREATSYTYFDTGWIASSTDPRVDAYDPAPGEDDREQDRLDDFLQIAYAYDSRGDQTFWGSAALADSDPQTTPEEERYITRAYHPSGLLERRQGFDVEAQSSSSARTHDYTYDENRRLVELVDQQYGLPDETTALCYDQADRVLLVDEQGEADPVQTGAEPDTRYAYSADGQIATVMTDGEWTSAPGSQGPCPGTYAAGKRTDHAYDDFAQETETKIYTPADVDPTDPATSPDRTTITSYWPSGDVLTRTKANETAESFYYDRDGMAAVKVRNPAGGAAETQHYDYDRNQNRVSDERGSYEYNSRDHLTSWDRPADYERGGSVAYSVDGSGQIITEIDTPATGTATTTSYDYMAQRLISTTTSGSPTPQLYGYDALGALSTIYTEGSEQDPLASYEYDAFGRQTEATTGTGSAAETETFTYDGLDRRESKTAEGETSRYAYVGLSEELATETKAGSAEERSYDYSASGERLGQESGSGQERKFRLSGPPSFGPLHLS